MALGVLREPALGGLFRAPQLRQEPRQDLGRQRQCIPLSRIALRQGAVQGEIDPEGAVAAEISSPISMLSGMLRRMLAIQESAVVLKLRLDLSCENKRSGFGCLTIRGHRKDRVITGAA
jgi:hypothetical protein